MCLSLAIHSGSCARRCVWLAKFGSFFSFFSNLSWDYNYTDIRFLLQSTGPHGFVHFSFLLSPCCSDCTTTQFIYSHLCFLHYIASPSTELFFHSGYYSFWFQNVYLFFFTSFIPLLRLFWFFSEAFTCVKIFILAHWSTFITDA